VRKGDAMVFQIPLGTVRDSVGYQRCNLTLILSCLI